MKETVEVVRCKDCKYHPHYERIRDCKMLVFPDDEKCPFACEDDFLSVYPEDDFFCANGEEVD